MNKPDSIVKRPPPRPDTGERSSFNPKRKLAESESIDRARIAALRRQFSYEGSSKHKRWPQNYGLDPYRGERRDAMLCDAHARFDNRSMSSIRSVLLARCLGAALVGDRWEGPGPKELWTVSDSGWIFEAQKTNPDTAEYHGYPMALNDPLAQDVYDRFASWAASVADSPAQEAAKKCRARYRLKP